MLKLKYWLVLMVFLNTVSAVINLAVMYYTPGNPLATILAWASSVLATWGGVLLYKWELCEKYS